MKSKTLALESAEPTIVTVQQHILHEQRKHSPHATGSFSWLLSGITLATKMTESRVRRAGLLDVLGAAGDVNVQGELEGFTALMTAAAEGQLKIVRLLLLHGADSSVKDKDGDTAESFALQKGHSAVVELLRNPPPAAVRP